MDVSLPGAVPSQEVPLQLETLVVPSGTEVDNIPWKQDALGVSEEQLGGVIKIPGVGETKEAAKSADGNSNVLTSTSKDGITEESSLAVPVMLETNNLSDQLSDTVGNDPKNGGAELSEKRNYEQNGAAKEEEERDSTLYVLEVVPKEILQVQTELQLPMRQLARKGGMLKVEAAGGPKPGGNAPSIANEVKEGILKKDKDQDKKEALAAVLAVHGRRKEAAGHAALFPGVTGPESGRLCQCCSTPESSRATIFCDKCERSFHIDCVKLWPKAAREIDVWHCGPCGLHSEGHYWPLGRVLIRYKDAVAEYQKYSSNHQNYRSNAHAPDERGQEKPDEVQDITYKVKDIRDFKKEARKGSIGGYGAKNQSLTGSVGAYASQPFGSKAEPFPAMQIHFQNVGNPTTVTRLEHFASGQAQGGIPEQPKKYLYPGYVPIQQRPLSTSTAPVVNFTVPPEATVARASQQPKTILPYTKYIVSPDAAGLNYPGSLSTYATPTKITYMTTVDTVDMKPLVFRTGSIQGDSQSQITPAQYVGIPDPNVVSSVNLPSSSYQIMVQPKTVSESGEFGSEISSREALRPLVPGERLTEREELLKEAKESMHQLRAYITAIRGDLGEGWEVVFRRRRTGALDKFFRSPCNRKYRSRMDVARHLGLVDDTRCQKIRSGDFGAPLEKALINEHAETASQATNLPVFYGDVMIEELGTVDSRPTYSDENQIWPVGFRSSWHDTETGSYCISEVGDGGDSGPVFRVTRKLVIGPAHINNGPLATTIPGQIAHVSKYCPIEVENAKPGSSGYKFLERNMRRPGEMESDVGNTGVSKLPAKGSCFHVENLDSKKIGEEFNKRFSEIVGRTKPSRDRMEVIVIDDVESGGKNMKDGEAVFGPAKNQSAINHSVSQAVIDLTESAERKELPAEVRSRDIMDARYSFLDVKTDHNTMMTNGEGKSPRYHSKLSPTVIDLSDAEDEKPPARDILDAKYSFLDVSTADKYRGGSSLKGPTLLEKNGGHIKENVVPPHIRPLPNTALEELTVEAWTSAEAWRLFGKQFVEHCRKSSESGPNYVDPILEATNDHVTLTAGPVKGASLPTKIANAEMWTQKGIDSREATKARLYARLENRLGEDRFGLNIPAVQEMIKALHVGRVAGPDKTLVKEVSVKPVEIAAVPAPPVMDLAFPSPTPPWKTRKRKIKAPTVPDITANVGDEHWKKPKLSPTEIVASHQASMATGKQHEPEQVVYYKEFVPAVVMPPPAPIPAPPPLIYVEEPRLPPPAGQPILKRLPPELVGDLLQVWEFLCRFSDLIGQESHLTLEDLEAGLVDMGPEEPVHKLSSEAKEGSKQSGEKEEVGTVWGSSQQGLTAKCKEEKHVKEDSGEKDSIKDDNPSQNLTTTQDSRQEKMEVDKLEQGKSSVPTDETQTDAASSMSLAMEVGGKQENASEDISCHGNRKRELQASEKGPTGVDNVVHYGTVSQGLVTLAGAHIPLLKFLVSDFKFRVAGSQNEGETDEPKKRGRKRIGDIGLPPEFGDDLPMNAITWPELAHRYLVAILDMKKHGEVTELVPEERKKLVRFFEGDGGVMGGAVEGVVGVESDAQVLAEAEKELTIRMPKPVEKDIVIFVPQEWDVALTPINPARRKAKSGKGGDRPEVLPKWVEALEPVRKMPTNLGTKIKNQVQESLDCKPPEWAKATLDWSLSKGTFKSNAAGTTKRAVLEVLAQYHGEELKAINAPRVRKVKPAPSAEHLMQRCRIVLREVAKADSKQVFCNLVEGANAVKSNKATVAMARPLDFRTIDARLAVGAYGGSTDAFAADMRQIWKNVEGLDNSGTAMVELAITLSQIFEKLYLKQVISLIKGVPEIKEKEKAVIDGDTKVDGSGRKTEVPGKDVDIKLGKAPWEDDTTCRVCGIDEDYDSILLCDGCDAEYHIYCLVPPLEKVPEGNWFCPSCLAVEEGFPEAPFLGEAEVAALQEEMERPVAGSILRLEFEDGKVLPANEEQTKDEPEKGGGKLGSETKPGVDVEDETFAQGLYSQPHGVESSVQALLSRMEEKEYWQLSLADRLFLLKFLCDEALKTPQVRLHLEKSVDVALDLQQQLRDLVAERLKIVVPMDVTNHAKSADHANREKVQNSNGQVGQSTEGKESEADAGGGVQGARVIPHTVEVTGAAKATSTSLSVPSKEAGAVDDTVGITKEGSFDGVEKVVHDLDLNVVAVREPDFDTSQLDHKLVDESPGPPSIMPAPLESGSIPVEDTKKRNLVDTGAPGRSANDTEQLSMPEDGGSNKRFKVGTDPVEGTAGLESHGRVEINSDKTSKSTNIATGDFQMLGIKAQSGYLALEERVSAQPKESNLTSESGTGVSDVPLLDSTYLPTNTLKRSLETESSGLPNTSGENLESGKKAKREEDSLVKSALSGGVDTKTNEVTKTSPDNTATNAKALEERVRMSALQSARDLDEKITKLGSKLFNSSLRREHMGSDHLGREYWALTGFDQRPLLVVAEMTSAQNDKEGKSTSSHPSGQNIGLRGIGDFSTFPPGKESHEGNQSDAPDMKAVDEGIRWSSYKGDKALDELVKWLSPKCQQERALRVAIYHWRRSVYPRHLLDMPESLNAPSGPELDAPIINELSKGNAELGELKETSPSRKIFDSKGVQNFPTMKATNILQKRYTAPGASGSDDVKLEKTLPQKDSELRRCECLEPLWTSRLHCQTCHETYESTAEFQLHSSDCPPGSKPCVENREKETPAPVPPKARKSSLDANKSAVKIKRLTSLDKEQDLNQCLVKGGSATRSERSKRSFKRGGTQPTIGDDVDMEIEEASEAKPKDMETLKAKKTPPPAEAKEPIEDAPSGFLKALEELMEPSPETVYSQPPEQPTQELLQESREENGSYTTTVAVDNWGTHSWPEKFDVRRGKQVSKANKQHSSQGLDDPQGDQGNRGGWLNDLNSTSEGFREDASNPFEYNPPAPMMFTTPESTRDRVNQIGLSDQGPTFTPGLHNSPAFDPSLMISPSPYYPCMDGFPSLEHSNSAALQYQQFMPPHDNLNQTPAPHTNFLVSLDDASSRPVTYTNFLPSVDDCDVAVNYLPPHDSLNTAPSPYTNFLPAVENLNSAPAPHSNFHQSLDDTNAPYANPNSNPNPSASPYANMNANANPSASPYPGFPPNNSFAESEPKRPDLGKFNLNSWFENPVEPMPVELPAVIPTKPTARRTSTWDYLTNIPLLPSQGSERFVNKHHVDAPRGDPAAPGTPIDVGSLPFDLMFEKPQRGDLNFSTVPEDAGTLTLDLMFEKQQTECSSDYPVPGAVPMEAGSLTLDLMFEKQEQECEGFQDCAAAQAEAAPGEVVGSLSIDLMSLPEEQMEVVQEDFMETVEMSVPEEQMDAVQDDTMDAADMSVPEEQMETVQDDPMDAAEETCVDNVQETQVDGTEEVQVATEPTSEVKPVAPPPPAAAAAGGKKPVKRFPVVDASVRPLVGDQRCLLRGLQISLLDMEAAATNDVLESSRASPVRRRAWRLLVKSAICIYELTKATILLEHMVKAEYLKPNWGYWSSLSAAARSTSLSSLALRLFALDAAITYERVKAPGEGKELANSNKKLKNKKKKKKALDIASKKKK